MHQLKDRLKELYPSDILFSMTNMDKDMMEDMLFNSSAYASLAALFKETNIIIKTLTSCIAEIEHGCPPSQSGSATPHPSEDIGPSDRDTGEMAQEG